MRRLFPLVLVLSGCMNAYVARYDIGLIEVERPANALERYGEAEIVRSDSAGVVNYMFSDSLISVLWIPGGEQLNFVLQNKSSHSIKIVWDEAAFVHPSGLSSRVMHSGVRYIERNAPQPPSVVARGGSIVDLVVPTDNVYYVEGRYGGWRTHGLFQPHRASSSAKLATAKENIGKKAQVLLPIEIEGIVNEYTFSFEVQDVEIVGPRGR